MGQYYLMRCIFLVDRNKRRTATITCNTRMETGGKSDSRSVQIVRFVRTALRRFPLMRCIFRVDRSCIRVVSLSEYWTCMRLRLCGKNHRCCVSDLHNTSFSLGFFESHYHVMVTYVGRTVLKRKLFSKLQQFWDEKQLSIFFYKKGEF